MNLLGLSPEKPIQPPILNNRAGMERDERAFKKVLALVRGARGLDYCRYKESFLHRRLAVRMSARGVESYANYLSLLQSEPAEIDALVNALNINVSSFYRDPAAFDALSRLVISPLIARQQAGKRISIWSAGCASGEEPYSVAMLLANHLGPALPQWDLTIHATDISEEALNKGRRGEYHASSFSPSGSPFSQKTMTTHMKQYFMQQGNQFILRPEIRCQVIFQKHDITSPPPLLRYNLILCRNVLIYFARPHQEQILHHMLHHLEPDGCLMLGMAEMLPQSLKKKLKAVDSRLRIYRKGAMEDFTSHPHPQVEGSSRRVS